jgi:AraC-like DNA-binding protein
MKRTNLKEQVDKKHLSSDFCVEFSLKRESKDKSIQINEKHLNHILFVLEGEINMSYHEFRNHFCTAGNMIFIPQDAIAVVDAYTDIEYVMLSFNNQMILHEELNWSELKEFDRERDIFHKLDIRPPLMDVLDSIVYYQKNEITSSYLHEVKEKEVFLMLKVFYTKQEVARFLKPLLGEDLDFKTYVMKQYTNAKNVDALAKLCNMSTRTFARRFKQYFNDSPYRWILKQRSSHIKMLLADSNISMHAIIKEYGFSSPAHFTTYCKRQFGVTPSVYRNSANGKHEPDASGSEQTDKGDQ